MAQNDNEPPAMRGRIPGATETQQDVNGAPAYETFSNPNAKFQGQDLGQAAKEKKDAPPSSISDAFQSIKSEDFLNVHQIPCARESFMTGIVGGSVVGAIRYMAGRRIPKAANWAFGAFFISSIIQWEYCRALRAKEYAAMARVVQIMDKAAAEKAAKIKEAEKLKLEEQRAAKKSWYKFW
ncbi:hypothetical protein F5B19DRAFT_497627 [Rostrohypoxylon terebratum]|nr:hypothetical protein F5B19DRAFT_497627 [Rostrohypoxylon terebratum]